MDPQASLVTAPELPVLGIAGWLVGMGAVVVLPAHLKHNIHRQTVIGTSAGGRLLLDRVFEVHGNAPA